MASTRFTDGERNFLAHVSELAYCNPFSARRVQLEKEALGEEWSAEGRFWSMEVSDPNRPRLNGWKIHERLEGRLGEWRRHLAGALKERRDTALYQDAVFYALYYRYARDFHEAAFGRLAGQDGRWEFYGDFERDWESFFPSPLSSDHLKAGHIFALFFQIHRAFFYIFRRIIGNSSHAADLRAAAWESIFTCDMRRYRDSLFDRMEQFATLITGPSGTGKDLVAQAIGLSRFLPFDVRNKRFAEEEEELFLAINLAALSPTLIESELFGHRKGAFTGALADRKGWLEKCHPRGCVFLDEIGDLDAAIQVKLLRVIESRTFQPVGETRSRQFKGKLLAATNRDLPEAIQKGEFREDLYFRLCSDQITMPSLADQLREEPELLDELVAYMAHRVAGEASSSLTRQAAAWIRDELGEGYPWQGNFRELEQCVRNILIRGRYTPLTAPRPSAREGFLRRLEQCEMSAEQLLRFYCTLAYQHTGSYLQAGRRLGLDRRTVKAKVDLALLGEADGQLRERH